MRESRGRLTCQVEIFRLRGKGLLIAPGGSLVFTVVQIDQRSRAANHRLGHFTLWDGLVEILSGVLETTVGHLAQRQPKRIGIVGNVSGGVHRAARRDGALQHGQTLVRLDQRRLRYLGSKLRQQISRRDVVNPNRSQGGHPQNEHRRHRGPAGERAGFLGMDLLAGDAGHLDSLESPAVFREGKMNDQARQQRIEQGRQQLPAPRQRRHNPRVTDDEQHDENAPRQQGPFRSSPPNPLKLAGRLRRLVGRDSRLHVLYFGRLGKLGLVVGRFFHKILPT